MSALPAEKPGIPHAVPFLSHGHSTVAAIGTAIQWRGAQMIEDDPLKIIGKTASGYLVEMWAKGK